MPYGLACSAPARQLEENCAPQPSFVKKKLSHSSEAERQDELVVRGRWTSSRCVHHEALDRHSQATECLSDRALHCQC